MKTTHEAIQHDETHAQSRSLRDRVSNAPKQELFQLALFLLVQALQWSALLMMCNTEGKHGTSNFITTLMISTSIGISLNKLNEIHKITFFVSTLAMCIYFLRYGW